ncbi:Sugar transferase involved in LPS biosynthesis (colanic, teichoic acid) [Clostridium grantii DSM 8605]|uniref:Sugar transferase involved in LPS biosynthesis (Colanic, teichoic acid) n=1 Tax=Clostridium grantii DSM 8605 TaxID=1121316 RepID=A0A1M5UZ52_9CLOT|nr:sugar transferase [Clostridium grantii]SHH68164.1 Sugar transferase involved in LPS biosynthesis (colanic, teichoic acid) [Clostridium grantii DSM 8605]
MRGGNFIIKRLVDLMFSFIALVTFSPLFIIVGILVYVKFGAPIIFSQNRVGKNGNIFRMYKFRTMLNSKNSEGNLLSDEERLTSFGKFLRSTSLDELPELINVLKGDMSLIGPRPLLVEYIPLYSEKQFKRHDVLPGLSGWAQINGRNTISWKEKFELDIWYVENQSFVLDLKIMMLTIKKVFIREGIDQSYGVTMEKFNGVN